MAHTPNTHTAPVKRSVLWKRGLVLVSLALLLVLGVERTLAYITAQSDEVNNQFTPAVVTCRVNTNSNNTVDVTNTGNVNAYIRASFTVNWVDSTGNVRGLPPVATDYLLTTAADQSFSGNDPWYFDNASGFYYHKTAVAPNAVTEDLITAVQVLVTPPAGYTLAVEVTAEALQADGDTDANGTPAFQDAWGIALYGN